MIVLGSSGIEVPELLSSDVESPGTDVSGTESDVESSDTDVSRVESDVETSDTDVSWSESDVESDFNASQAVNRLNVHNAVKADKSIFHFFINFPP